MDPRLEPNRPGQAGILRRLSVPLAGLHRKPDAASMQVTQALMGERLRVFEREDAWCWCQLLRDGYVGYIAAEALGEVGSKTTHRVSAPSTFLFPRADIKSGPVVTVTMNAEVAVAGSDGRFLRLDSGAYVFAPHLKPVGEMEDDFVAVAEMFLHVPYLWGGKSVLGLDCSGLVQLALEACGIPSRRDSDMQEEEFGEALPASSLDHPRRGDLVFWDGHVGIMSDAERLLHANGHHMKVVKEPLREAVARIARRGGQVTSVKRMPAVVEGKRATG